MSKVIAISGKSKSGKDICAKLINQILFEHDKQNFEIKSFAEKLKEVVSLITGASLDDLNDQLFKQKNLNSEWYYYSCDVYDSDTGDYIRTDSLYSQSDFENYQKTNVFKHYHVVPNLVVRNYRNTLQTIGTELFREQFHKDVWVNALFHQFNDESRWLITDLRFKNELERLKSINAVIIRVERFNYHNLTDYLLTYPDRKVVKKAHTIYKKYKDTNEIENKLMTIPEASQFISLSKQHVSETELDNEHFDYYVYNTSSLDFLKGQLEILLKSESLI